MSSAFLLNTFYFYIGHIEEVQENYVQETIMGSLSKVFQNLEQGKNDLHVDSY